GPHSNLACPLEGGSFACTVVTECFASYANQSRLMPVERETKLSTLESDGWCPAEGSVARRLASRSEGRREGERKGESM
ncbi:MAG: hypothetical protein SGPRY_000658, partial [Prymnesium sp.]